MHKLCQPESAALAAPTERARAATSHPLTSYSFMLYLAYALYPPLYLAGPIMTYNAFLSQLYSPPTVDRRTVASYAMRFLACLFTMELVTHSMYVVAIKDESRSNNPGSAWDGATPFQLSMVGFWNLIIVWLKVCPRNLELRVRTSFAERVSPTVANTLAGLPSVGSARRNGSA